MHRTQQKKRVSLENEPGEASKRRLRRNVDRRRQAESTAHIDQDVRFLIADIFKLLRMSRCLKITLLEFYVGWKGGETPEHGLCPSSYQNILKSLAVFKMPRGLIRWLSGPFGWLGASVMKLKTQNFGNTEKEPSWTYN